MLFATGSDIYLLIAGHSKSNRSLVAGRVVDGTPSRFVGEFDRPIEVEIGAAVVAFGNDRGRFMQQGAALTEVVTTGPLPAYAFEPRGEAFSAEQRQTFRVSVAVSGLLARVGAHPACPVTDLSPEGFGVIVPGPYDLGATIDVRLEGVEGTLEAAARVQTARDRHDGTHRLGLLLPDPQGDGRRTLRRMAVAYQRLQLRRLACAAA
jgi:hypothetical protein